MQHIADAAAALAAGRISAASLVDAALDRIADPSGEGRRAFTAVHADAARAQARAIDALRHAGRAPSPWAGIPVTVKDLFDEHGHPTREAPPCCAMRRRRRPMRRPWRGCCGRASSSSAAPTWSNSPSAASA
ncbi:hypothetical protein [Dankookia sp. P2]|uniref:hypothetical protein n=1 Tax=Dankookia sp. P2 TaxID=3423955 RepID=UPI003D67FE67